MAKTPKSAPVEPQVSQSAEPLFEIKVNRVVTALGVTFRPMHSYVVTSAALAALGDAVASSAPAAQPPG